MRTNSLCCSVVLVLSTILVREEAHLAHGFATNQASPQASHASWTSSSSSKLPRSDGQRRRFPRKIPLSAQFGSDDGPSSSPRVKFNQAGDDSLANPLDRFLSFVASDAFSIAAGALGLLAVVVHRWNLVLAADGDSASAVAAAEALTYQTRTDLLGVFASGSVLLNGVTKLDVTTALAESVVLEGTVLSEPEFVNNGINNSINDDDDETLSWALGSLLTATPAKTAVLLDANGNGNAWTVRCRAGVVPPAVTAVPERTPILDRVGNPENSKETYLPTLQALPGRTELTYLPPNAQMAVLIPIKQPPGSSGSSGKNTILVLGGNTAKSFTPRDIAWSRIVAERLGKHL